MNELDKNFNIKEGSFIYTLHEKLEFNIPQLNHFIKDLIAKIKDSNECESDKLETMYKLYIFYKRVSNRLVFHFDQNDLVRLIDLTPDYFIYLERIDFCINAYYLGDFNMLLAYEDDIGTLF
jgi:hypothetical protein